MDFFTELLILTGTFLLGVAVGGFSMIIWIALPEWKEVEDVD